MRKKVWWVIAVLLATGAVAGTFYAHHQAESLIADYIKQSNEYYLQWSQQGDLPPVQMNYKDVSVNILTSSYQLLDFKLSIAGTGDLITVDKIELIGFQPNTLSEKGTVHVENIKLTTEALRSLPADLAEYLSALPMTLSYQYRYNASTGGLSFEQMFSVDQRFNLNYSFVLTGVTKLWRFAETLQSLTPEQQQQQAEQSDYVANLMKTVAEVGLEAGSFRLKNQAFLQQFFDKLAQSELSADYSATQLQWSTAFQHNLHIPEQIRKPLLDFLKQPGELQLNFTLPQPLTFAQMQDGSALQGITTVEQLINYAGITLTANSN